MFPCPTSRNQGQHKYGSIRFIGLNRQRFIQACRYCKEVRAGAIVVDDRGVPEVVWKGSRQVDGDGGEAGEVGLENNVLKDDQPQASIMNIDAETGEIKPIN